MILNKFVNELEFQTRLCKIRFILKLLWESTKFEYCSPPGAIGWKIKGKSISDGTHPRPGVDFSSIPEKDADDVGLVCTGGKM